MSNYPDDIRDFDHHPFSPFYVEPEDCEEDCREIDKADEDEDYWEGDE